MPNVTFPRNLALAAAAGLLVFSTIALADPSGADPGHSGAPGEATCVACHSGAGLNRGAGRVTIKLAGANTYAPGVKQRIQVEVADPAQRRWGFQLSARLTNAANGQAGELSAADTQAQVVCADGRRAPCANATVIQYVTHTLAGTRNGTTGSATFEFDWTPPATDQGPVRLYAAGNAANGNNSSSGDNIYSTSIELTPAVAAPEKPSITQTSGVRNAANAQAAIAPNTWITIAGANLAAGTRAWKTDEFLEGKAPAALDETSVTVNGKPAAIQSISPGQITAITPNDDSTGPVEVRVTSKGQSSDPVTVDLQAFAPALFTRDGKFVASPGIEVGGSVKPGATLVLYGTGLGPLNPVRGADQFEVTIGGVKAEVQEAAAAVMGDVPESVVFAGLTPPFAELYKLTVVVPEALEDGDQRVIVRTGGVSSPEPEGCCFVSVRR